MKKKDFAVIPFNSTLIKDRYLVSNMFGSWDLLDKAELQTLSTLTLRRDSHLFKRLYNQGIVADSRNIKNLLEDYKKLNANLFRDTSLHIAVLTTRCNLACQYCQSKMLKEQDMTFEVAGRVLKYLFETTNPAATLEFQGGEPLLNWDVLCFLAENVRKFNTAGRKITLALVTNLSLLDSKKMKFLIDHEVDLCVSLDGPKNIHDTNRFSKKGKGIYDTVTKNIGILRNKYGKKVNLLPTITKGSLNYYKEIIDEYIKLGEDQICLRPVNKLGVACSNWPSLGVTVDEFCEFYKNAMDYMLDLNKKGIRIRERITTIMLSKILNKTDPGYVDMMNPCGAGRSCIVYMPDGDCYPCDEARMTNEEMFKLGNIVQENYAELIKKENLLYLLESSLVNLWDYNSAFAPWLGTCPVLNYTAQKNMIPKIWCSSLHKIYNYQLRYTFEKILESDKNLSIFKDWAGQRG